MFAANDAPAAAEPAREEHRAEPFGTRAMALGAGDGVGHVRPVPEHVAQGTQTDCAGELPFWSIHSPPAPMQVPQAGGSGCSSSLATSSTVRREVPSVTRSMAGSGHLPEARLFLLPHGDDRFVTTPADPDLRHLADLLDFLPGPSDREFWAKVHGNGELSTDEQYVGYMLNKLAYHALVLRQSEPARVDVAGLAKYLIMFFGGRHPKLLDFLSRHLDDLYLPDGTMGRLWTDDLITTCWRIYVRYSADGSWAHVWPEDYSAWRDADREGRNPE
jgi:hypothetical protein